MTDAFDSAVSEFRRSQHLHSGIGAAGSEVDRILQTLIFNAVHQTRIPFWYSDVGNWPGDDETDEDLSEVESSNCPVTPQHWSLRVKGIDNPDRDPGACIAAAALTRAARDVCAAVIRDPEGARRYEEAGGLWRITDRLGAQGEPGR
jgi:hypothetical protein